MNKKKGVEKIIQMMLNQFEVRFFYIQSIRDFFECIFSPKRFTEKTTPKYYIYS